MNQGSRNRKESNGFRKAIASAPSNMERRKVSRYALQPGFSTQDPVRHPRSTTAPLHSPHISNWKKIASACSCSQLLRPHLVGFKMNVLRYLGLGRVFQACWFDHLRRPCSRRMGPPHPINSPQPSLAKRFLGVSKFRGRFPRHDRQEINRTECQGLPPNGRRVVLARNFAQLW